MSINILTLLLTGLLSGCVIAPGMSMRTLPEESLKPPEVPGAKVIPISAATLRYDENDSVGVKVNLPLLNLRPGMDGYRYRIARYDVLSVTVWDHPELTMPAGEFRTPQAAGHVVAEDGTIFYPYAGTVRVAGRTVSEVRTMLRNALSTVLQNPQIDVRVVSYRSQKVFISGQVTKPGPQEITDVPLTVADAIGQAGDVAQNADMRHVTLARGGKRYEIDLLALYDKGDMTQNVLLQDGDILNVPDRSTQKVFVIGEVGKPSSLIIPQRGMSLTEAIGDAGGVDRVTSDPVHMYVIRGTEKQSEIYYLNAYSPDALVLGDHFRLKARDIVYVETAPVTRWSRVIDQLIPGALGRAIPTSRF